LQSGLSPMNSKFNMYAYISYIQAKMNINDYK